LLDPQAVPIVLVTDPPLYYVADHANAFGYGTCHEAWPTGDWRNGPRVFELNDEDWQARIIIVIAPMQILEHDDWYWEIFIAEVRRLTGRQPDERRDNRYDDCIFC